MLDYFVKAWDNGARAQVEEAFRAQFPSNYGGIVREVVAALAAHAGPEVWSPPDPERVNLIDHGDYQGTLVFIIGAKGYQPSTYWAVRVAYGSCSTCDTFQRIQSEKDWKDASPGSTHVQLRQLMQLALHIVQGLKEI